MDRHELAWAAGFFDGEGWAARVRDAKRARTRPMARVNQAGDGTVPEVLIRFQEALGGLGSIGGPDRINGRRDLYRWVVASQADVERLFGLLSPRVGTVKLMQLAHAAEGPASTAALVDDSDDWPAWAAGLYDAEGCSALLHHRTHSGYMTPELSLTQSSPAGVPEVLRRFTAIVGQGTISGPYQQRLATMDVYRWKAAARSDVERVLSQLWPFLSAIKRAQAQRLLDTLAAQPDLPRGNPAFGYHKTHCVHGHEYAIGRLRPYVSRGLEQRPRDNEQCLTCLREYARRQRELKRSSANDGPRSISESVAVYLLK